MPIAPAYQNPSLDGMVASWTAGVRWALFDGDPTDPDTPGVELSGSGYTSPAFAVSDFAAASGQSKDVAAPIDFGTSTDIYDEVGTHWAILDAAGGLVYSDDLDDTQVVEITAAGTDVTISPSIFFEDGE